MTEDEIEKDCWFLVELLFEKNGAVPLDINEKKPGKVWA